MLAALIVYFFIPHISNNHRAKLLHPILIGVSVMMFLLGQFVMSFLPRYTPVVLAYVSNISPESIVELTNKERIQAGLPEVTLDPLLTQAALAKGAYMFAQQYWAHTAPDGTEPWKFINDAGYKYRYAGENLARDFATPETAVSAWMASPTHKDNLLSPKYQDIGVAVIKGDLKGVQTTIIVQMFGTKMSKAIADNSVSKANKAIKIEPEVQIFNKVAGTSEEIKSFNISPFKITKNIAFFLVSLFFFIISLDMIIVKHKNVPRTSSKSLAHMLFFSVIMIVIFVSQSGLIL